RACGACRGGVALVPMTDARIGGGTAEAFARKVTIAIDPECEARFPAETVVRVSVRAKGRDHVSQLTSPRGEAANPPRWDERLRKFDIATRRQLDARTQADWHAAFRDLEGGRLSRLRTLLASE